MAATAPESTTHSNDDSTTTALIAVAISFSMWNTCMADGLVGLCRHERTTVSRTILILKATGLVVGVVTPLLLAFFLRDLAAVAAMSLSVLIGPAIYTIYVERLRKRDELKQITSRGSYVKSVMTSADLEVINSASEGEVTSWGVECHFEARNPQGDGVASKLHKECAICSKPFQKDDAACYTTFKHFYHPFELVNPDTGARRSNCHHIFHELCAQEYFQDHTDCPQCGEPCVGKDYLASYLV